MPDTNDSTRPAPVRRLKPIYYAAASTLQSAIHKYKNFTPTEYAVTTDRERRKIEREIERLGDEAGVDHSNLSYRENYEAALKALGGTDESSPRARRLRRLADDIERRRREAWAAEKQKARTQTQDKERELFTISSDVIPLSTWGLEDGDTLEAEEADDLKPGEMVVIHWKNKQGEENWCAAWLASRDEDGTLHVEDDEAAYTYHPKRIVRTLRALSFTRAIKPSTDAADAKGREREREVARLRARLEKFNESDDWESQLSGHGFKLEKQIYDLERERELDEWPDVIGDERSAR